jgi:hypothetical protein
MANLSKSQKLKYHIVYQTTNITNNNIYIGAHSTNIIDDGYIGSGKLLKRAIIKYGKSNFERIVLFNFSTPEEMFEKEKAIVTEEFISSSSVYNIVTGGFGGNNKGSQGLRHLTNIVTGEVMAVDEAKAAHLIDEGWILKGHTPSNKGKVYVCKGDCRLAVAVAELHSYIQDGWSQGYPKSPTDGKIWIYSKTEDRYSMCTTDELNGYIADGWIKQKWAGVKKGSVWINKDGVRKRIPGDQVLLFLSDGWVRGKVLAA